MFLKLFKPGEWIPYSGVYRVIHHEHLHTHEVTCVSGETFPQCRQCSDQVRFALLSAARSIKKHSMFSAVTALGAHAHDVLEGDESVHVVPKMDLPIDK